MSRLPQLVVLVSGRGTNLQAIGQAIDTGQVRAGIKAVVTDNPQAGALAMAADNGWATVVLDYKNYSGRDEYNAALLKQLVSLTPDLIVLSGYMRLLPAFVVQQFPGKILNIHPSLLPAFPGLHPHRQALDYGVKLSGCTVHFVDEGMDTGPIIMQQAVPVRADDTEQTLADRVLAQEHVVYPQAIQRVLTGGVQMAGRRVIITDEGEEETYAR